MVPHLTTALTGPLLELERHFLERSTQIEHWMRGQWQEHTPPFYTSCDLRNSGFKLAPVDTNLFPGGFNNLNPAFLPLCVQAAMTAIEKFCPEARNLLLIPENHTRNQFYLQNVAQLVTILRQTGLNIRLGSLLPEITQPTTIELPNGQSLLLEPLIRSANRLGVAGFDPCAILLNNDLSAGIPPMLQGLHEQFVLPPLHAGWAVRRKSNHFAAYDEVANDFAKAIGMEVDASGAGLGIRSQRYAMVIEDGVVTAFMPEEGGFKIEASTAECVLTSLKGYSLRTPASHSGEQYDQHESDQDSDAEPEPRVTPRGLGLCRLRDRYC